MKEQLLHLLALQTIDAKVKELQAAIKALPARLEPARRDLAKLEGMLGAEKSRLAETESWRTDQQGQLEREQEALKLSKNKLQGSKTGKEYNAATREVDNKRRSISEREAEVTKVNEALGKTRTDVEAHDKDVDTLRAHLANDEREVAARIAELEIEITAASQGRGELRALLPAGILKTYDTLASKRGYAVAPVVKGTCQGCHMALPPQLNNTLVRMISIETCPRCSRLIYRKELLDPPEEGSEGSGSPPA